MYRKKNIRNIKFSKQTGWWLVVMKMKAHNMVMLGRWFEAKTSCTSINCFPKAQTLGKITGYRKCIFETKLLTQEIEPLI